MNLGSLAVLSFAGYGVWIGWKPAADQGRELPGAGEGPVVEPCPECLEAGIVGHRRRVLEWLLRDDCLPELVVVIGAVSFLLVLFALIRYGGAACWRCCCQTTPRRRAQHTRVAGALPAGY